MNKQLQSNRNDLNDLNTIQGYENEAKKQTKEFFEGVESLNISEEQKTFMLNIAGSVYIGVDSHVQFFKACDTNTRSNVTKAISKAIENNTEFPSTNNLK